MSVSEWIPDFARRLAQLDSLSEKDNLTDVDVWLGGLFFPEAYITATRQAVAHRKKWSLETLHLRLDIERMNDPNAFIIDGMPSPNTYLKLANPFVGLVLEGASWVDDQLVLNQGESVRLNPSQVRWVQADDVDPNATFVNLPVYLNNDRSDVLFTVDLPFDKNAGNLVSTRAVCLTASG